MEQHGFLLVDGLSPPLLSDSSGFQSVSAPWSPVQDSFWMEGHTDLVATASGLGLCVGHLFWRSSLFTWLLTPDNSAAVNPRDSQGSLPWLCTCCGLLISITISVWPWLWPPTLQYLLQGHLTLSRATCGGPPGLLLLAAIWLLHWKHLWMCKFLPHLSPGATKILGPPFISGLLPLCAPLLFLFRCICHILCGGIVPSGISPGFQMGNGSRGPCLLFNLPSLWDAMDSRGLQGPITAPLPLSPFKFVFPGRGHNFSCLQKGQFPPFLSVKNSP